VSPCTRWLSTKPRSASRSPTDPAPLLINGPSDHLALLRSVVAIQDRERKKHEGDWGARD
jgi:hypothetical protein